MKTKFLRHFMALAALTLYITSCDKIHHIDCWEGKDGKISVKLYAGGLNNPRGIKFGPDGNLYVAEGGIGGKNLSTGCDQVIPPVGPYTGSTNGSRISMITETGRRTTAAGNLPSTINAMGAISGVGDVAFIDHKLYAVLTGAGCSHGVPSIPNGVITIKNDGSWSLVADLSAWLKTHPVKNPEEDDFEPDGDWYSMIDAGGDLYAMESNHGVLVRITKDGAINRVADISASFGHIVPTAMAFHNGSIYFGNLNPFPIIGGSSSIYKVSIGGKVEVVATNFTTVLGLAFDEHDRMYVLQNTTGNPFPTPGTGNVVRVDKWGDRKVVVSGLNLPTAITFGPDDKLYISNWGFGPPALGGGQILQATLKDCFGKDLEVPVK